jgi:hypothetical protein
MKRELLTFYPKSLENTVTVLTSTAQSFTRGLRELGVEIPALTTRPSKRKRRHS